MTADALAGVLGAIAAAPSLERGLCVNLWDTFDATDDPAAVEKAKSLCQQCPVLARCAEWSARYDDNQLSGIIAGQVREWSPTRRRKVSA